MSTSPNQGVSRLQNCTVKLQIAGGKTSGGVLNPVAQNSLFNELSVAIISIR